MRLKLRLFTLSVASFLAAMSAHGQWAVQPASGSYAGQGQVSEESRGECYSPMISADGRYVIFGSFADDLTSDAPDAAADVFRFDRQTGEMRLVSDADLPPYGMKAGVKTFTTSADGTRVAYSFSSDIISPPQRPLDVTVFRDLSAGSTLVLSEPTMPPDYIYPGVPARLLFSSNGNRLFLATSLGSRPGGCPELS